MGTVDKEKRAMTTIQVEKAIALELQTLGRWGDTYSTIIRRLLNGSRGDPHEDRREARDESTWDGHRQEG